MAEVDVIPTKPDYLTIINFSTGGTAFTADGIKFTGNGRNVAVFKNTGVGVNTVTVTAYQTKIEGFDVSNKDIAVPAGEIIASGWIGNQIASNQIIMNSTNPTEVEYIILDLAK